jgi:hypothetical protein
VSAADVAGQPLPKIANKQEDLMTQKAQLHRRGFTMKMKMFMVATCLLMFCFTPSKAWAQNCKPDISGQDKISKKQVDYWFKTVSTSGVAITVLVGRSAIGNSVGVQIDKQEAAATSNTEFQSPLRALKGNQFYFGLKNGEPLTFVATDVSNEAKVSGSFMAGFSGKNLYTKVVLEAVVQNKDLVTLRDALTRKQVDGVRIVLAGDVVIQASVSDKDGAKLMEKFGCFYQHLDKNGIDLSVVAGPQSQPVQPASPSNSSAPGKYLRKGKSSDYLELNANGTFSVLQDGKSASGTYNVQGDNLTVTSPQIGGGGTAKARFIGNTILDNEGIVWEKQAEPQKPAAATQLTNDQIIQMVAAKLPDDIIITTIQKSSSKFDLTPEALIKLKTAGVSDAVIRAMTR